MVDASVLSMKLADLLDRIARVREPETEPPLQASLDARGSLTALQEPRYARDMAEPAWKIIHSRPEGVEHALPEEKPRLTA